MRVEPGFDVREQAAVDFQSGLEAAHEGEDGGAVPLAYFLIRIETQANVVVALAAHGLHSLKKADRFLDLLAHLENIAQDDEAVGTMLLQHGDSLSQLLGLLVDVGQ